MEARREARARAAASAEIRKAPEVMSMLRAKFLRTVESYIGVPYGRKYHADDPASAHHDAPLYLDCCALVRRSVRDLQVRRPQPSASHDVRREPEEALAALKPFIVSRENSRTNSNQNNSRAVA